MNHTLIFWKICSYTLSLSYLILSILKETLIMSKITRSKWSLHLGLLSAEVRSSLFNEKAMDLKKTCGKVILSLKTLKICFKTLKPEKRLSLNSCFFYFWLKSGLFRCFRILSINKSPYENNVEDLWREILYYNLLWILQAK